MSSQKIEPEQEPAEGVVTREASEPVATETSLRQRVNDLEEQLRSAKTIAEEEKERYLRVAAEVDNKRRRLAEEAERKIERFKMEMAQGVLRALDNLERALDAIPENGKPSALRDGIELTLKEFGRVLEEHGLHRVGALGECFDPGLHEAVAVRHDPGKAENEILKVHRPGYCLGDQLVRPAQVVVNQRPCTPQESARQEAEDVTNTEKEVKGHVTRAISLAQKHEFDRAEMHLEDAAECVRNARATLENDHAYDEKLDAMKAALRDATTAVRERAEDMRRQIELVLTEADRLDRGLESDEQKAET